MTYIHQCTSKEMILCLLILFGCFGAVVAYNDLSTAKRNVQGLPKRGLTIKEMGTGAIVEKDKEIEGLNGKEDKIANVILNVKASLIFSP